MRFFYYKHDRKYYSLPKESDFRPMITKAWATWTLSIFVLPRIQHELINKDRKVEWDADNSRCMSHVIIIPSMSLEHLYGPWPVTVAWKWGGNPRALQIIPIHLPTLYTYAASNKNSHQIWGFMIKTIIVASIKNSHQIWGFMIKHDRSSSTLYIRSLPFAKQVYRLSWLMAMFIEHLFLLITSFLS